MSRWLYQWARTPTSLSRSMPTVAELEGLGFRLVLKHGHTVSQCGALLMRRAVELYKGDERR